MAIARMSRLRLIGLKSEKNRIMNELVKSGSFEVIPTSVEGDKPTDRTHLDKALARQAKTAFAVDYLSACADEYRAILQKNEAAVKKGKEQPVRSAPVERKRKNGRTVMGYDDFYDVAAKEYELAAVCDTLEKLSFARLEYKSRLQKVRAQIRVLAPYERFPLPLSALGDGKNVTVLLAHAPSDTPLSFGDLPVYTEKFDAPAGATVCVVARLCDKEQVTATLTAARFVLCPVADTRTPADILSQYHAEEKELAQKDNDALYAVLEHYKYYADLKTLYDVIGQDVEKSTAELEFTTTASTFVAEGWIPFECADAVIRNIRKKTAKIVTYLTDPQEGETPPTLVVSKKIFKPYEDVTNMYSVPAYHEIDPNPFMAVFFFLFFGVMIGDAGYGAVLSVAALLILRFCKLERGVSRLIALVGMGGVSAIVWGLVFGGVFSISGIPPLWFNPTEEPLMMLGVSVVLGVIQLLTGYALKAAKSFRAGHPLDAVLDSVFIFILFGGIACIALDMLLKSDAPLMQVGLGLIVASLAGILCTAGRHNKGALSKVMGGFSGLYGLVNLLSDVLSYARLFGLGLASGAIGAAFNTLGSMFFSVPVVGYAIGFIILIPLHAFNLGIGVLGAYVHNARLQFLEFYGKFYEGDGRLFRPMGEKTRYVRFGVSDGKKATAIK